MLGNMLTQRPRSSLQGHGRPQMFPIQAPPHHRDPQRHPWMRNPNQDQSLMFLLPFTVRGSRHLQPLQVECLFGHRLAHLGRLQIFTLLQRPLELRRLCPRRPQMHQYNRRDHHFLHHFPANETQIRPQPLSRCPQCQERCQILQYP